MLLNESPKDAYGRPIKEGDGLQLVIRGPILFRVARIETNMDPTKPAGLMVLHVFASAAYHVKSGAKHGEFIRIGTAEELGPLPFSLDQTPGGES